MQQLVENEESEQSPWMSSFTVNCQCRNTWDDGRWAAHWDLGQVLRPAAGQPRTSWLRSSVVAVKAFLVSQSQHIYKLNIFANVKMDFQELTIVNIFLLVLSWIFFIIILWHFAIIAVFFYNGFKEEASIFHLPPALCRYDNEVYFE